MTYEIPQEVLSTLAPEVIDLVSKPEVLAVLEAVNKGLVTTKQNLLTEKGQLRKTLDELGGEETVKQKLTRLAELEAMSDQDKEAAAKANRDVEAVRSEFSMKLGDKDKELNDLKSAIAKGKVTDLIKSAFNDAEDIDLIMPFVEKRIKHVVDGTGSVKVNVVKDDGTPMFGKNADEATLSDLAEEMRNSEKYARLFKAVNNSGSGAGPGKGPSATNNPFMKNSPAWNVTEQARLYRANPQLAISLASAAGIQLK